MKQELVVAYYGNKAIGWSHVGGVPFFQGDKEWIQHAKDTADKQEFVSLYEGEVEGVAQIDNPENLKGVFLALAALPRERVRISKCPAGMLESLGIEIVETFPEDGEPLYKLDPKDFSRDKFLSDLLDSLNHPK